MAASLTETPSALRLKIAVIGRTNSGKSSLINALCGQAVSLVSAESGTTTDPVTKPIEIYPLGPCLLIDTAGFGDTTPLGKMRMEKTAETLEKADMVLLVVNATEQDLAEEKVWMEKLVAENVPVLVVVNQIDVSDDAEADVARIQKELKQTAVAVSALQGTGMDALREEMIKKAPESIENPSLTAHLVKPGDKVLLVMPQDKQDVLTLLCATEEMVREHNATPVVTMSMGPQGVISRIAGKVFGSAMTFGTVGKSSAPGQLEVEDLRTVMKILR